MLYLKNLKRSKKESLLVKIKHGIERECLRVDSKHFRLSQKPHPRALGHPLTHPYITTDYSEALLEFISPVYTKIEDALDFIALLQRFTAQNLDRECLWAGSMPCTLGDDNHIPIANYGSSNIGQMKTVYRHGLWHRYGKPMQTIAGIHYNFSMPDTIWSTLYCEQENQDVISRGYFAQIRNFMRHSWLLIYLFGASPALSKSFMKESTDKLQALHQDTLYLPYATSLRMSDLGYTNRAQEGLGICLNDLKGYVASMERAINTIYPPYEAIGIKKDGAYLQLNCNILQIENEYYSTIRPKRVIKSGESSTQALREKGVEYIEIRCMDVDPFEALGISDHSCRFLDLFLVWCALEESPCISQEDCMQITTNFDLTVTQGRNPNLTLSHEGRQVPLKSWALEICKELKKLADIFDDLHGGKSYNVALSVQEEKIHAQQHTPSAKVLQALKNQEFEDLIKTLSMEHHEILRSNKVSEEFTHYLIELARQSHADRRLLEQSDILSFEDFLAKYFSHS